MPVLFLDHGFIVENALLDGFGYGFCANGERATIKISSIFNKFLGGFYVSGYDCYHQRSQT